MTFQVHGTALLPINLSRVEQRKLIERHPWMHWTDGLTKTERLDKRRFFNRSTVDLFRPLKEGRWCLDLANSSLSGLELKYNEHAVAQLTGVQLVAFGTMHFLYLNISAAVAEQDIYPLQRQLFSFFEKSHKSKLPQWQRGDQVGSLREWIECFIDKKMGNSDDYMEDWLGHELPYCLHVEVNQQLVADTDLIINLAAGADPAKSNYNLASQEASELQASTLAIWRNWHCLQAYHRFIFVGDAQATALHENLSNNHYYVDLFALAVYQRLRYEQFQEALTSATPKVFKTLNLKIRAFRQRYNIAQVSGYPLAQRLYAYICERLELRTLEQKVFNEIDYQHGQQQRVNEEKYNFMLFSISVLAAIILPLDSLSALMALPPEQRDSNFWLTVLISGFGVLVIMLLPVLWRSYRRSKSLEKDD